MSSSSFTVDVRAPAEQSEGTRSQVLRWLKSAGEPVVRDEPLIELETDKVTVEVAAPASGVLSQILKQAQDEVVPGDLLGRIETREVAARSGVGSGSSPGGDSGSGKVPHAGVLAVSEKASAALRAEAGHAQTARAGAITRSSPAVRRLLADHGLEPFQVRGTGQDGRITVDDVLQHVAEARSALRQEPAGTAPLARTDDERGQRMTGRLVPHSPLRKRIAEHMVRSLLHTAPHVTTAFDADFSAVLAHRERHRDDFAREGVPLTLTAYILAACVGAIRAVPEVNARWTDEALEIFDAMNIGVATALPEKGLIVPVVRNVQDLSLEQIARELARLVALARGERLAPHDVRDGTFTISNHGVSGSVLAAPIVINQPQTAILGVGKVEKRPVVIEESGEIVARARCFVTLTVDHRVMDGHRANRFLEVLVGQLDSWPSG